MRKYFTFFALALAVLVGASQGVHAGTGVSYLSAPAAIPDVEVQNQQPSGTALPQTNAGDTLSLNTVIRNNNSIGSLASNTLTLPAGNYYMCASASFGSSTMSPGSAIAVQVYNSTDAAAVFQTLERLPTNNGTTASGGPVLGCNAVTISASKGFQLHRVGNATLGAGMPGASSGNPEVYAELDVWKY